MLVIRLAVWRCKILENFLKSTFLEPLAHFKYIGLIFIVAFLSLFPQANSAVVLKGQSCAEKKVDQIIKSTNSYLICKKTGSKYIWQISNAKSFKSYREKIAELELARLNAEAEEKQKVQAEKDAEMARASKELEEAQAARQFAESQAQRDSLSKGAAYRCIVGKFCSIGNIGPGGGIVFIGEGIAGNGKHYEIAPKDWLTSAGDPQFPFCTPKDGIKTLDGFIFDGYNEPILQYPGKPGYVYTNNRVGDGKNNTRLIIERCKESAAAKAASYVGAGFNDWFLPSAGELLSAYLAREKIADLLAMPYWSSSQFSNGGTGKILIFDNAGENRDWPIGAGAYVRPIRNF